MPDFWVMSFNNGKWDRNVSIRVDAEDEHAAAELVCGEPLVPTTTMVGLRAEVSSGAHPERKLFFRAPVDRAS